MVEVRKLPKKEAKRSDRSSDHNVTVEGIFASFFGFNSQGINGRPNWPEPPSPPVRICLLFEEPPHPLERGRHKWMAPKGVPQWQTIDTGSIGNLHDCKIF